MRKMTDSLQFISFGSVIGNALCILYQHNIREVTFDKLVQYAKAVVKKLEYRNDVRYGLLFDRKYQLSFLQDNADFFDAELLPDGNGRFFLKDSVTDASIKLLEERFRWTMGLPFLDAFYADDAVNVLLA